ncbi:MAG: hypothetical protein ABSH52_12975 [Terriglobia bacterium]|jgi:hypothetical protein
MPTVNELSIDELKALIEAVVEEKLQKMLRDPDEGLSLRPEIERRLIASLNEPKESRRTVSAQEVARDLGLNW